MATYVSPMPRHRRATYGRWRTELAAGLAAGRPDELARLLNSAALLFAEHRWRAAAVDCLTAQLVLADDGALAPDGDLDAFVNLVRLSMTGEAGGQGTLGFWLDAIDGGGTR
ncbi:MAG TPA: hypothetical protein VG939_01225, partial [Caulobacteraceae bacterium]|nr:hypothetical protein [Caulobacteraceae bacterium]